MFSGVIQLAGTVIQTDDGKATWHFWLVSSVMQFEYRDHVVNLLDTPVTPRLLEDTYRVLTAGADSAFDGDRRGTKV